MELATGNKAFAFDLYQAIRCGEDNLLYSACSLSVALIMSISRHYWQLLSLIHNMDRDL